VKRIIQLNNHVQLISHTLYNAVCNFDIVLSSILIASSDLHLVATVCYWMAAKFENRHRPSVTRLNTFAGTTYTAEVFKTLELQIVEALGFELSFPTTKVFLWTLLFNGLGNATIYQVANVRPSTIAAPAVAVALTPDGIHEGHNWLRGTDLGIQRINRLQCWISMNEFQIRSQCDILGPWSSVSHSLVALRTVSEGHV
jgi:hypothetical protein